MYSSFRRCKPHRLIEHFRSVGERHYQFQLCALVGHFVDMTHRKRGHRPEQFVNVKRMLLTSSLVTRPMIQGVLRDAVVEVLPGIATANSTTE